MSEKRKRILLSLREKETGENENEKRSTVFLLQYLSINLYFSNRFNHCRKSTIQNMRNIQIRRNI